MTVQGAIIKTHEEHVGTELGFVFWRGGWGDMMHTLEQSLIYLFIYFEKTKKKKPRSRLLKRVRLSFQGNTKRNHEAQVGTELGLVFRGEKKNPRGNHLNRAQFSFQKRKK